MAVETKEVSDTGFIKWFSELNKSDGQIAGGKGANLGEMFNSGLPVPPGFAITTNGYKHLIEKTGVKDEIDSILESIDVDETADLEKKAKQIREIIKAVEMPEDLKEDILEAYEHLSVDKESLQQAKGDALNILKHSQEPVFVAVRSSATTEDLDDASFAGQQETYLNIKGNESLIKHVKTVFASLFTARAIFYRKKKGFSKEKFALSVIVQKMIDAEKSGVMFSQNPINKTDNVLIEAVFGLGEGIVSGKINPDSYEVSRDLKILDKKIADKKIALTRNAEGKTGVAKLSPEKSNEQVLKDHEITAIADYGIQLEDHYKKPQDIEFALEANEIFIVQSRPVTTQAKEQKHKIQGNEILSGLSASPGVASGKVKVIHDLAELDKIKKGDILVTKMTNPNMVVTMQKSAAIVTDEGGITCHASIVSREMGIPAVVGTKNATETLKDNQIVTVDGFNGKVFSGESETIKAEVKPIVATKTKIKVIVDLPEATERAAKSKSDSIGLLRLEGIIASSGKHPVLFQKEKRFEDYTKLLADGISKISEPFKEIWIRTSDIRSDEYSNLEGAPKEIEVNPMLGFHGIRFSLKNPGIFKAELLAIKKCAEKFKDKKFGFMMPQIISPEEITETKKIANELGMQNIKIGIMVETPASCFIIKNLLKEGVDFVSFGTNDLTQFTLAIDRGNEEVQYLFDETHPAILNALKRVIRTCKELGVESSICGQAGSNKEMVKHLVEYGIDSISVNADAAYEISKYVAELESQQAQEELKIQSETQQPEKPKESDQTQKPQQPAEQQHKKQEFNNHKKNKFNKHKKHFNKNQNHHKPQTEKQTPEKIQQEVQEITQKAEQAKQEITEQLQHQQKPVPDPVPVPEPQPQEPPPKPDDKPQQEPPPQKQKHEHPPKQPAEQKPQEKKPEPKPKSPTYVASSQESAIKQLFGDQPISTEQEQTEGKLTFQETVDVLNSEIPQLQEKTSQSFSNPLPKQQAEVNMSQEQEIEELKKGPEELKELTDKEVDEVLDIF